MGVFGNDKTHGHALSAGFSAPRLIARGTSTKAPMVTRLKMMVGVEKSLPATARKKYGTPQARPMARNKRKPLRDILPAYLLCLVNPH